MQEKIILFGAGSLGLDVAAQLHNRSGDLMLVDDDADLLDAAKAKGFRTSNIDYRDDENLKSIGIGRDVGLIFCLFPKDASNVFLTISARALAPDLEIVTVTKSGDSAHALRAAGADKVIDPYEISGRKIHDLIRRPLIAEMLEQTVFGQQDLNLAEVVVTQGSDLDGRTLDGLEVSRNYNLLLLGMVDRERGNDFILSAGADSCRLDPGDVLVVIGPTKEIDSFKRAAEKN